MSNNKLRLALIGLGKQGLEHLQAAKLANQVEFVAGVDKDIEACQRVQKLYSENNIKIFENIEQLKFNDIKIDGLVLSLPHHCYAEVWPTLLEMSLPMLKEKPLGRNLDEAMRLLRDAETKGQRVQTAIQRRHHPSYKELKWILDSRKIKVQEIHAHMHLGFSSTSISSGSWRDSRDRAGGGALLDSGYHLVDLVHFLFGPFDLVSASLWGNGQLLDKQVIDDQVWLVGRSEKGWVALESWVGGFLNQSGKPQKSERILLKTNQGFLEANREGVWHNGEQIYAVERGWSEAMAKQLDDFATRIRTDDWKDELIWDQLPAMRLIDEAYELASRY